MIDADKFEFLSSLGALFEMFGQEATTPRMTLYWRAMRTECSIEQAKDAMAKAVRSATRLPTVADLLEHVNGKPSDRAEAAWADVMRSATVSYMVDLDFEDRTINAVIRTMHGRNRFFARLADPDDEKWLRLDFIKCYMRLDSRELSDEAAAVLAGEADRGEVMGREYKPRLQYVRCAEPRPCLTGPREDRPRIGFGGNGIANVKLISEVMQDQ